MSGFHTITNQFSQEEIPMFDPLKERDYQLSENFNLRKKKKKWRPCSNQQKIIQNYYFTFNLHRDSELIFSHVEFGQGLGKEKKKKNKERKEERKYLSPHPREQLPEH